MPGTQPGLAFGASSSARGGQRVQRPTASGSHGNKELTLDWSPDGPLPRPGRRARARPVRRRPDRPLPVTGVQSHVAYAQLGNGRLLPAAADAKSSRLRPRKHQENQPGRRRISAGRRPGPVLPVLAVGRPAGRLRTGRWPSGQVRAMPPAWPAAGAAIRAGRPGGTTRPGAPRRTRPVASYPASGSAFPCAFRGWPAQRDQAAVPVGRPAHRPLIPLRTAGDSTGLSADTSRYRGLSQARNGFRRPMNHTSTARRSRRGRDHARRTCRAAPGGRARPARFRPRSRACPRPG